MPVAWCDALSKVVNDQYDDEQASALLNTYKSAFPPGYQHDFDVDVAAADLVYLNRLNKESQLEMCFSECKDGDGNDFRFKLYRLDKALPLSDVMPILEKLGMRVIGERPYCLVRSDSRQVWLQDFSLSYAGQRHGDIDAIAQIFEEAFSKVWFAHAESDSFNQLVVTAGMGWREVALLRAYRQYLKQVKFGMSTGYIASTLTRNSDISRQLVTYFDVRFNPSLSLSEDEREVFQERLEGEIIDALDSVDNLNDDRIIRQYLAVIKATLRTNFYQLDDKGISKSYFSFKLQPEMVPNIPLPIPMYEIFVYSPRVEGVHLRGGKVARGGLRWSDRVEDFRTEVLGLVKAQQVKNAVIVPAGAKGGFIAKQSHLYTDRESFQAEGIECYKLFIQGLLDITDNLKGEQVVPPDRVVRCDADDPYLVVAADKGTATFSDIANEISIRYGHWLGDAFASGGSVGYDHKGMGITAKGAWVSVQRLFREKGINIQEQDFTVVGIGDMGGDVFGNGMLLSEHIQLTAAFNHLDIFIDPNPNAAASFIERKRLFALPRSSWKDYDQRLISAGGGVFSRSEKSIPISPEMRQRFNISVERLTPNELITAVLKAPVDLFWNGGIGTYVKASSESDSDVGDRANDGVRVNGKELRCQVVGEGGNLGLTQLARVEFALNGGAVNTDFIDNAAGVDCSDHEVNIKILINKIVEAGDLNEQQRCSLLESMTDAVSELVLENNYRQTQAISLAERQSAHRFGEYRRLIDEMESSGRLNRGLEYIPEDDALVERMANGKSLTRPELSLLISYVKSELKEELIHPRVFENAYVQGYISQAFPQKINDSYPELVKSHQLQGQIIATQVANSMVNHMGITFVERMRQSTGASIIDVALAYVASQAIFDLDAHWRQIEALDHHVSAETQMVLMADCIRLVRRATRWFIRNRRGSMDPMVEVPVFKEGVSQLNQRLPEFLRGRLLEERQQRVEQFMSAGVPEALANAVAGESGLYQTLGIVEAAHISDTPVEQVAEVYFELGNQLELDWFAERIGELKIDSHWQALARESFRDDIESQQRALAVSAVKHLGAEISISECIEFWAEQQSLLLDRWKGMIAELHSSDSNDFAMFSVAIRELFDLVQSSAYEKVA